MSDISVGAVGAAVVAGLVSLLGLVIGKEQKVSEFRQSWIDDLRKCLVCYLVSINAISDVLRLKKSGAEIDDDVLVANYKLLNEASLGITLRINPDEDKAKALRRSMLEFESISKDNSAITPEKIREIESSFIEASQELLKFEWSRVKRGEKTFVWTKWIVTFAVVTMIGLLAYLWATRAGIQSPSEMKPSTAQVVEGGATRPDAVRCGAHAS